MRTIGGNKLTDRLHEHAHGQIIRAHDSGILVVSSGAPVFITYLFENLECSLVAIVGVHHGETKVHHDLG